MADFEELRNMVSSFRVSELQVLLGFAGRNKSGRKHDLLMRALHLLKSGCSPAVQIKIRELYRRRYPRTIEGLSDLTALKSSVFNLDSSSSPAEPDLAVPGLHPASSTSVAPQSPSSPLGSVLLQDTKPRFEMQQPSPSVPPVHPDVQLKNLPFYDVLDVLIKPTSLVQSSIQRFQEKFFIFALTPQQVREICISRDFLPGGRRDYTVQVQLRLCLAETSCSQEDNYPNSLCIKVNGKLFPLPGYAPPPKNGIEQKRPGRPLNITSLVRLSSAVPNQISISWTSEIGKNYSMSVYLVRQLTSAMLLQRLKLKGIRNPDHSRALIKEKLTADPDSEIATTSLRVSLMCPLGKMRLTIPCRAGTCTHLQCFDAALYLQMNEKKPTWICPVCDKKATYENLILDGLFMEILNECSDVDEIKFQEDGSWCPMRPKKEPLKVVSTQCPKIEILHSPGSAMVGKQGSTPTGEVSKKKVDVIDLTVESSSDEEEDAPPKRKCIYMSDTQASPTKGVLVYQPAAVRVPGVSTVDSTAIAPSLTDYSVPFHHPPISSISSDLPVSDLLPSERPWKLVPKRAKPSPEATFTPTAAGLRPRGTQKPGISPQLLSRIISESIAQGIAAGLQQKRQAATLRRGLRHCQTDMKYKYKLASAPFKGDKLLGDALKTKDKKKILPSMSRHADRRSSHCFQKPSFRAVDTANDFSHPQRAVFQRHDHQSYRVGYRGKHRQQFQSKRPFRDKGSRPFHRSSR